MSTHIDRQRRLHQWRTILSEAAKARADAEDALAEAQLAYDEKIAAAIGAGLPITFIARAARTHRTSIYRRMRTGAIDPRPRGTIDDPAPPAGS